MSGLRLFGFLAVAAIAFACAPRTPSVSADDLPAERESPEFVIPEDIIPELEPRHTGLERLEDSLPDLDRVDLALVDEMISTDSLGSPPVPVPENFRVPEPTYPSRRPRWNNFSLRESGATGESERAVALGLAWLARQQKEDGSWEFAPGEKGDRVAATGLALLPFLLAGETHIRPLPPWKTTQVVTDPPYPGIEETHQFAQTMAERSIAMYRLENASSSWAARDRWRESKYYKSVAAGLNFLRQQCSLYGPNAGRFANTTMTGQTIATRAFCEAYAATGDPSLKDYAQAAIHYLQKSQNPDGGWSDTPDAASDVFVVGWAVQALNSARLVKELSVDARVLKKASQFLDSVAAGERKATFGVMSRAGAEPGTTPTAVGLLCRYYIDGWSPNHPGMIDGVAGIVKNPPLYKGDAVPGVSNLYYYYYATQVVHFYEGEDWKNWNEGPVQPDGSRRGGMREWLINTQNGSGGADCGSWDPEAGWFGTSCGRVGTTAMCVLTLEVYYRYRPLDNRNLPAGIE